jgi:mannan endo-1,6-alpha-mannosidase
MKTFSDKATGVIVEVDCELTEPASCDTDMKSFKAYFTRWLAATAKVAPFTYDQIAKFLLTSAQAAAAQCTGGAQGRACGLRWVHDGKTGVWDGTTGVGEQMSALEVIQSTLIGQTAGPVTNNTGGTSIGNSNAGSSSIKDAAGLDNSWIPTTGDKASAGILTAVVLAGVVGGMGWISME